MMRWPIKKLYDLNIPISINTDNSTVSNITLTEEYIKLSNYFNFTLNDYKEMNKNKNVNSDEEEKIEVLDVPEPEEKCIAEFCPFCGTKNPGGNFCLNCGHCLIITKKKKK